MSLSFMQLKEFKLLRLIIKANENYNPDSLIPCKYDINIDFDIYKAADRFTYKIPLICVFKSRKKNCGIKHLEVKAEGIFEFKEDTPKEFIEKIVPYNCLSILYGLIRGVVTGATGSIPGGSFLMPALNFIEVVNDKTKKRNPKIVPIIGF